MTDTPVNPSAGAIAINGVAPAAVQRQPGLSVELQIVLPVPDVFAIKTSDTIPIVVWG